MYRFYFIYAITIRWSDTVVVIRQSETGGQVNVDTRGVVGVTHLVFLVRFFIFFSDLK